MLLCFRVMKKRSHLTSAFRWLRKGWNSIDLVSHILLSALLIIRLLSLHMKYSAAFISMAAGCAVLLWSKVLFFMMPFATTGVYSYAGCSALKAAPTAKFFVQSSCCVLRVQTSSGWCPVGTSTRVALLLP